MSFSTQNIQGKKYKLTGSPAELQDSRMLFRADEIYYDEESGDLSAAGHVFFRSFETNERLWASRVEYNTKKEGGKFYDVRGETPPRALPRPGLLTTDAPFHFEGEWAERIEGRYVLHDGWITNCRLPQPWWRLRGPTFDIQPGERAIAHRSTFRVRGLPIVYAPFYYHSLRPEVRKSGILIPNVVPFSRRGFMVGGGYYWAISRSYDATYRIEDYTSRAFAHHVDFRAKPREGTDLNVILYGVQDRGKPDQENPPTYSGVNLYMAGQSDLGNGWTARGYTNYITSFRFHREWSGSFIEAIAAEIRSSAFVNKNWSTYTLDLAVSRLENFQETEKELVDPETNEITFLANSVTIRKLPEAELTSRDHKIWRLPLWFSFDSAAGFLYRAEPIFEENTLVEQFQTRPFTPRLTFAPQLVSAMHWRGFHLVPSIGLHETYYGEAQSRDLERSPYYRVVGTNIVRSAREASVDLILPSVARVFQKKTVFGERLKHVIEPRATYRYVTGVGRDFNRFLRFDETDLLSDTNEVEFSLTNRVYARRGNSVNEIFTWQLFQKRYFDPTFGGALLEGERNVFASTAGISAYAFVVRPRSASPVVSLLRLSPIAGLGLIWQADYDSHYGGIVDSAFQVDYRWSKYSVSIGNNAVHKAPELRTPAANQYRFRVGVGDANRRGWNFASEIRYDYRISTVQDLTSWVSYNTDCCGISVQYQNIGFRNDHNLRIAFVVANVGSFGTLRRQDRMF
jgi:LPS-assembly protein